MNNKISKIQIGMLLSLICCSFYLGISDVILLELGKKEVLISMIIGIIIGFVPVLMYLKINSTFPNSNIYEKNTILFGKILGTILNIIILLSYIILLIIAIRAIVIFVTSKYLQVTPYILVGSLVIITSFIICSKGLEAIARISQISFFISLIFMIFIELFLTKYVEIENILPMFVEKNYIGNIVRGAIYYSSSCGLLTILLLSIKKSEINNTKNYNKTIILFYLIGAVSLLFVMLFVVSCFGYNMASLFRYPEYILLKKIGLLNSELHLENLLAFRWIIYMIALANISLYSVMCGIKNFSKNSKLNKIIIIIICIICTYAGKIIFGDIPHSILLMKNYYTLVFGLPTFILLTIIFIRCIFIKNTNKTCSNK